MHEFFIEEEKLEGLLQLASEKTGISKQELQEKLSGVMQDGKIVVNEQIYGLLSDPKKLEMLLNSGIVGRLLKELGRQKESGVSFPTCWVDFWGTRQGKIREEWTAYSICWAD